MKPNIRFNGFEDEWVEKKLGEVTDRFDSDRKAVAASNRTKGDIPYYGAVGIQGHVNGYTHDGDYLLIAEDGASSMLGYPVRVTSGKIWVNNHAHVLEALNDVSDNNYLKNKLMTINMTPYITGGSRHKLTAGDLSIIKLQLPSFSEQQKIGALFEKLDAEIAAEQAKIDWLKEQKKGLLQKVL